MTESNNIAGNGLDADAIVVIIGGTLVCGGGLMLAHSTRVQGAVAKLLDHPVIKEMGRAAVTSVVRGVGETLSRWGTQIELR